MLPAFLAVWFIPGFTTQDGPGHIYNAHILLELFKPDSFFHNYYVVNPHLAPNLVGHWLLVGLLSVLSPQISDKVMMTITGTGVAAAVMWLRWRVVGWEGFALAAPLAVVISLNLIWLLGFYNFLVGTCLFTLTLGWWWEARKQVGVKYCLILAALFVAGYLCHIVSLVFTVLSIVVLAIMEDRDRRLKLWLWTALSFLPLLPLLLVYKSLTQAGDASIMWMTDINPLSPASWLNFILAPSPLALNNQNILPFVEKSSSLFRFASPTLWIAVAIPLLLWVALAYRNRERRFFVEENSRWLILGVILLVIGLIAPDGLGANHGSFLRMRILLLALITLLPALTFDLNRLAGKLGYAATLVALILQSAFVWEYAFTTHRNRQKFMQAVGAVGDKQRIVTVTIDTKGRFNPNPLLHINYMLGVNNHNILWGNYQASSYYFPTKFVTQEYCQRSTDLQRVELFDTTNSETVYQGKINYWANLLAQIHTETDVLVVWGFDEKLDSIHCKWFDSTPIFANEKTRVFRHQ